MRIAIVGAGVSGLTAAYLLSERHDVTLYEAQDQLGGHAHTETIKETEGEIFVDTGFLVYNEATYPLFITLLERLGIESIESVMSFSYTDSARDLEWKGTSLNTIFAQRRNLLRPSFLRMVLNILSFNRAMRDVLVRDVGAEVTLGDVVRSRHWGAAFRECYLVPMGAAIWSANPATFDDIPARTFAEFFSRHGLLQVRGRPTWRTIVGGSRQYVARIAEHVAQRGALHVATPVRELRRFADGVEVVTDDATTTYDHVVVACHSDEALALLRDPSSEETEVLGAIRYQSNEVTLHWDAAMMPSSPRAWAAWNYRRLSVDESVASLTYNVSTLQSLAGPRDYLVSLNSDHLIDPAKVLHRYRYAHPVLDQVTVRAQQRRHTLVGRRTSFCGAYFGYGFHEDGVRSAVEVCAALGVAW